MRVTRKINIPDRWLVHSYYTLCPYAPDGSGRLLFAGVDLDSRNGYVYILDSAGNIVDTFGEHQVESGFYHTGFWQTWSPDARYVYYQSGSLKEPSITRRELSSGKEIVMAGDAEGAPPDGEPVVSGLMGMLYAAGYGYGVYNPSIAPVPFEDRDSHGIFEYNFDSNTRSLRLSINDILNVHPDKDKLLALDSKLSKSNGTPSGLTLMTYCVRWSQNAERLVFYFGNHCVVQERGEPRIANLFTCKRNFSDLKMALDLSSGGGVHWSWHPDNEHLIGYGNPPDSPSKDGCCVSTVKYDGTGFRKQCSHIGCGHPSVSTANHNLLITDTYDGDVIMWDIAEDRCIESEFYPAGNARTCQRNEFRVCHHPVFNRDGSQFLFNVLDSKCSSLYEVEIPEAWQ